MVLCVSQFPPHLRVMTNTPLGVSTSFSWSHHPPATNTTATTTPHGAMEASAESVAEALARSYRTRSSTKRFASTEFGEVFYIGPVHEVLFGMLTRPELSGCPTTCC